MLRSIKQLYGHKVAASDGEIGHVKDFYFDDQRWATRYLVVDTGEWLTGRRVLISPHSVAGLGPSGKVVRVNLTRRQIENSPSIGPQKPISRLYEEEYCQYYGWPRYWQGDALWGMSGFPVLELPAKPLRNKPVTVIGPQPQSEVHLRSTQAVNGYLLRSSNETIGHVCDFIMDSRSWAIGQLVAKIGHRLSGKETLISTTHVDRISYEESTVFLNLTQKASEQGSAPRIAAVGSTH